MHYKSYLHIHEQNKIIERKHNHKIYLGLAILSQVFLSLIFWDEILFSNFFLINQLPSSILDNSSPLKIIFGVKPNYGFFKVFGYLCFPCLSHILHTN